MYVYRQKYPIPGSQIVGGERKVLERAKKKRGRGAAPAPPSPRPTHFFFVHSNIFRLSPLSESLEQAKTGADYRLLVRQHPRNNS